MSRFLYHTDAFILGSYPSGEAGRLYDLLTPRVGRALALAHGVREVKSKLRYHLTELMLVRVSLARAKSHWRLTYVEPIEVLPRSALWRSDRHLTLARLAKLIRRLVAVEEGGISSSATIAATLGLYEEVFQAIKFLADEESDSVPRSDYETLVTWRVLLKLGYCRADSSVWPVRSERAIWRQEQFAEFAIHRPRINELVEEALYHSHL